MQRVVTAILKPKDGQCDKLLSELKKVQKSSLEEEGCITYKLHQNMEDNSFLLYEVWQDDQAVQLHNQAPHYQEYRKNTAELIENREVYKLNLIE